MISKRKWLKDSLDLARDLAKQQWVPLLALFLVSSFFVLSSEDVISGGAATPSDENQRMMVNIALAIWDLCEGLLVVLILSWGVPQIRNLSGKLVSKPFSDAYLGSFFAEYLRMMAYVLLWGLAAIIPGFVAYCRYGFVPLIALFSREYREGEADAIDLSKKLTKPFLWRILIAQVCTMLLEVGLEIFPEVFPALHNYVVRLICLAATYALSMLMYSLIFTLFQTAIENSAE